MYFFCCLAHPSVLARRDVLLAAGGYSETYPHCEDYDLWLRLLLAPSHTSTEPVDQSPPSSVSGSGSVPELANLPEVLLRLRKHGGGVSAQRAAEQAASAGRAVHAHLGLELGSPEIDEGALAGLRDPGRLATVAAIEAAVDLLLRLERHCCARSPKGVHADIKADCTSRVGELVTLAMRLDAASPSTTAMWQRWLARDPRAMLAKLME